MRDGMHPKNVKRLGFTQLIPIGSSDQEQADLIKEFADLYFSVRDAGLNPIVALETTPDGDVWKVLVDDQHPPGKHGRERGPGPWRWADR